MHLEVEDCDAAAVKPRAAGAGANHHDGAVGFSFLGRRR